jgi:hypothetical protein
LYDEGSFTNGISLVKKGGFVYASFNSSGEKTSIRANFNYTKGWQNLVLIINNDIMQLYLNGFKTEETVISTIGFKTDSEPLGIGAAINSTAESIADGEGSISQNFDGFLDEISIYDLALGESEIKEIAGVTALPKQKGFKALNVYPNPACEYLNVVMDSPGKNGNLKMEIINPDGRIIHSESFVDGITTPINIKHLNAGIYILKISGNKKVHTHKFIKRIN